VADVSRHGAFTALSLSGLLMLSACGSGKPAIHIAGGVASVVHVGPYTQVFSSPLPANPAQADVVEGFREGQVLWEKSANASHLVSPVRDYVTGQALAHLMAAVNAGKTAHVVPAGTDRFFMTRVTAITGHNAIVATCDDESKFEEVNPHTGKVDTSFLPSAGQEYLFETWQMVKRSGHWAITALSLATLPAPRAESCQPGMAGAGPFRRPDVAVLLRHIGAAMQTARSVHLSGTIQDGGKSLGVDLAMARSGQISGQISEDGAVLTVLATRGHSYLKVSAAFLKLARQPTALCSLFCGKYLELTPARSQALLNGLNMRSFVASLTRSITSTPARSVSYLGMVTVDGKLAWLLSVQGGSVFVSARGRPYILRLAAPQPGEGAVNLTQWNAVRIPGPPPASQVVNLSQLTG
jgi:hypothetical protein